LPIIFFIINNIVIFITFAFDVVVDGEGVEHRGMMELKMRQKVRRSRRSWIANGDFAVGAE
jgi:hypothetical protein